MKRTPWYPGHIVPARNGVYERFTPHALIIWSRWDGEFWCQGDRNMNIARNQRFSSIHQDLQWRGLTTKDGQ